MISRWGESVRWVCQEALPGPRSPSDGNSVFLEDPAQLFELRIFVIRMGEAVESHQAVDQSVGEVGDHFELVNSLPQHQESAGPSHLAVAQRPPVKRSARST